MMKRSFTVSLWLMLAASSQAWAEEKHLLCTGDTEWADDYGNINTNNIVIEFQLNEEENSIRVNDDDKWEKCRDPEFTTEKIKCNSKGDFGTLYVKKQFEINRYTGILYRVANLAGAKQEFRLQCRAVTKEEQLF